MNDLKQRRSGRLSAPGPAVTDGYVRCNNKLWAKLPEDDSFPDHLSGALQNSIHDCGGNDGRPAPSKTSIADACR